MLVLTESIEVANNNLVLAILNRELVQVLTTRDKREAFCKNISSIRNILKFT